MNKKGAGSLIRTPVPRSSYSPPQKRSPVTPPTSRRGVARAGPRAAGLRGEAEEQLHRF